MKKLIYILILAAVTIGATSCVKNGDFNATIDGEPEAHLVLNFHTPNYGPGTRAMAATTEKEIESLWVLVFSIDNANSTVTFTDIVKADDLETDADGETTGDVMVPQSKLGVDATRFVILANCDDILSSSIGKTFNSVSETAGYGAGTYAEVMPLIEASFSAAYDTDDAIPMWGETGDETSLKADTPIESYNLTKVSLTRALARVDVGVGARQGATDDVYTWDGRDASNAIIPFQLTGVYIYKASDRFAVVNTAASGPTIPTAVTDATKVTLPVYSDIVSNLYITREIYVPEAITVMGAATPANAYEDSNHTNRMAIVVRGKYDSNHDGNFTGIGAGGHNDADDCYYRIDFLDVTQSNEMMNVLRNHLYTISITGVTGAGTATADEAYNSNKADIVVNVEDWTLETINNVDL